VKQPTLKDESFIADMRAAAEDHLHIHLWWLGQSGFLVQCQGRHLLFDPYLSDSLTEKYANTDTPHVRISERVVHPGSLNATDVVTSSHNHTDHLDPETLVPLIRVNGRAITLVAPEANRDFVMRRLGVGDRLDPGLAYVGLDVGEAATVGPFQLTAVLAAHDQLTKDSEGRHVYLGYVVRVSGWSLYHSGDTVVYPGMARDLAGKRIDVAMLPINGKAGNMDGIDAAHVAKDIGAKLVIPCHYDMFEFNTADPYEQFVPECERIGQPYRVLKLGERLTLPERSA
jgi:L-ascorbate metabolism protein UlaG (beta-lactamase superfamily)